MSDLKKPHRVKLFFSLLYQDISVCEPWLDLFYQKWGRADIMYHQIPFLHTSYYEEEFGKTLERSILSFSNHIERDQLIEAKLWGVQIENQLANDRGNRTLNIDPGYVTDYQVVLATGKNYSHRIYLDRGVFADLTMVYREGKYQALPWTYPDYIQEPLQGIFTEIRKAYLNA